MKESDKLNELFIKNFAIDINLANKKGFIKNEQLTNEYINLQNKYYYLFELYLIEKLGLKELEDRLLKSSYFYPFKSNNKLMYFSIESNINIETLNNEELKILKNETNTEILRKIVESTFNKVIKVNYYYGKKVDESLILYGSSSSDHLKSPNSLVLGFTYDKFNDKLNDDDWEKISLSQLELTEECFEKIKKIGKDNINCNIEFLEYYSSNDSNY